MRYKPATLTLGLFTLLILALLSLVAWRLRPVTYHGVLIQSPQPVNDFQLESSAGQPLRVSDLHGRYVMLYFGYTSCPDLCPLTLADLAEAMRLLGDQAEQVQVIFITVDPARDTVQRLATYLPLFHPTFLGLTGATETLAEVSTQFGIYHAMDPTSGAAGLIDHTNSVLVLDRQGRLRLLFPPGLQATEMAADLAQLIGR
jgi:protein SCO1